MRNKNILVRVSEDEKTQLEERAKAAGMSVSDLLRQGALKKNITPKTDAAALRAVAFQLAQIGNNINQIARKCHRDKFDGPAILMTLKSLRETIQKLAEKPDAH